MPLNTGPLDTRSRGGGARDVGPLGAPARLAPADIRQACGDILDWKVEAIVGTGGDIADLQKAVAWLDGRPDALGGEAAPLTGAAARIYELLQADEDYPEEY